MVGPIPAHPFEFVTLQAPNQNVWSQTHSSSAQMPTTDARNLCSDCLGIIISWPHPSPHGNCATNSLTSIKSQSDRAAHTDAKWFGERGVVAGGYLMCNLCCRNDSASSRLDIRSLPVRECKAGCNRT